MTKSFKRRGGAIVCAALVGAAIGAFFAAPIAGAVLLSGVTAGALFLLAKLPMGPM